MELLVFVEITLQAERRSGIHRVAVEAAKAFLGFLTVHFVKWDEWEGQLRYIDHEELKALFHSNALPPGVAVHTMAQRVWYRFEDTIKDPANTWLWFPEIAYHRAHGNDVFARVVSQCHNYGVRVASVFYDLIPITNPLYQEARPPHQEYVAELIRSDLILPISAHVGDVLVDFYADVLGGDRSETMRRLSAQIRPIVLPEINSETPPLVVPDDETGRDVILMVGTVEPRKQQVEALRVFNALCASSEDAARLQVHIYGSLHGHVADALHSLVAANPRIKYFDYASAEMVEASYRRALFSVFASYDEGYGLPIAESLARGVPCLCANFGSMAEIAEGGGCLPVDVNNKASLTNGLERLIGEPDLRERLRDQLRARRFRTWSDYARATIDEMQAYDAAERKAQQTTQRAIEEKLQEGLSGQAVTDTGACSEPVHIAQADNGVIQIVVRDEQWAWAISELAGPGAPRSASPGSMSRFTVARRGALIHEPKRAHAEAHRLFGDDYWAAADENIFSKLLDAAVEASFDGLLPHRWLTGPSIEDAAQSLAEAMAADISLERRRYAYAMRERAYATLLARWRDIIAPRRPTLAILITTYNRARFVEKNVEHVLHLIASRKLDAQLIVVDNFSTDDTRPRLARFFGHPNFEFRMTSSNVGMLGNLRVCSSVLKARHVWVTGDDDFIDADALAEIIAVLKANPGLPMAIVNFGVYHRESLSSGDSVKNLMAECVPLAPNPMPSGLAPLTLAGQQHDNLFTAVYPIVWRADLFAAAFNYPFTGVPFDDLVECVPSTKFILETCRFLDVYWHAPIGIAGNAHNSWSRHRPRWHVLLMPLVFELARDAGMSKDLLYRWAQAHYDLFCESLSIAKARHQVIHIEVPHDLVPAVRMFRRPITIPPDLKRFDRSATPQPSWMVSVR
ncbi:MAG: glycosyltransferase [Caulobacterales bacterium]